MSDRALFTVTMAVCSLVSARVRDGAVFDPRWDISNLRELKSEWFYAASSREAGKDVVEADLNTLRSHAILALTAIQDGRIRDMHDHLGRYHTLVAMNGLHDEDNWPGGISLVEIEERRRLFWSIYTLDVFTSIVWSGVIRSRECQSNVQYPTEADDDTFDDTGFANNPMGPSLMSTTSPIASRADVSVTSWMTGRICVIDLYRVIEHVTMRFPVRRTDRRRKLFMHQLVEDQTSPSRESVQENVMQMYHNLPKCLKETNPVTCKPKLDRFGFQAADIVATVQLLRMVLFSATGASISERCQIANEVVNAFIAIPTAYRQAISVPLLFHLGVIGQILGTALEQPLSQGDYSNIREVLVSMMQLLASLEEMHMSKDASQRLRDHIARTDEYMDSQRGSARGQQLQPTTLGSRSSRLRQDRISDSRYTAYGAAAADEALAPSPFQLPPDLLGDFTQIFDFSQMPQG